MARDECYRCHKPIALCVCRALVRVDNRTPIHVLQHKRERFHPLGTARFARLGLARARVLIDDPREREATRARLLDGPGPIALLYPSPTARLLGSLAPSERPGTLLVLDGTWSHARSLVRDNPWLLELPQVSLVPAVESRYRIRAEPFAAAVSTIEAITEALGVLEPGLAGLDGLIDAFVHMIDQQIELSTQRVGRFKRPRPPRASRAFPPALTDPAASPVLVFGELAPHDSTRALSWCAVRLRDGARLERWMLTGAALEPHHLRHMGLGAAEREASRPLEDVRAEWRAFLREGDVLVAWNKSTLATALAGDAPAVLLKEVYANTRRLGASPGSLLEVAAREGLSAPALPFVGRAGVILGALQAVLEHLRAAPLPP